MSEDRSFTIREVSGIMKVSTITIKRWVKRGLIKGYRVGKRGDHRFLESEIKRIRGEV